MPGVDSILRMMIARGADELWLVSDEAPRMLQHGAPSKLAIPVTDGATVRHLLGELLSPDRAATVDQGGKLELSHALEGGETFAVVVQRRRTGGTDAIEAHFRRGGSPAPRRDKAPEPQLPAPHAIAPGPPATDEKPIRTALPEHVAAFLANARSLRASDVHLHSGRPPALRIDGRFRTLPDASPSLVEALLDACADDTNAVAKLGAGHSVDRPLFVDGAGHFRVHLYLASNRRAAALRVLPPSPPTLGELHFSVPLADLVDSPHGLILVCGPTGAGKSATLAALALEARRRTDGLLVTHEDPIEYLLDDGSGTVRQRHVGSDVSDFATGLRDALREDPDVLLIGEMRDPETISLALTAAETGHLVLASMHSRSAASSIERIVDAYPAERQGQIRVQLADALRAVVSQRLLPRARGNGRLPAVEILRGTYAVASLIREGKTQQLASAIQSGRKEGMVPLERCLADLVRAGQITREAAMASANDLPSLVSLLAGA